VESQRAIKGNLLKRHDNHVAFWKQRQRDVTKAIKVEEDPERRKELEVTLSRVMKNLRSAVQ
jgi:hypothetical protein